MSPEPDTRLKYIFKFFEKQRSCLFFLWAFVPQLIYGQPSDIWDAIAANDEQVVVGWLAAGGNPNLTNAQGQSLVMQAARYGHLQTARQLLEQGANPNTRDHEGETAISLAVTQGSELLVRLMADLGAHLELRYGKNRETLLMRATRLGHLPVVELLLKYGVSLAPRDTALLDAMKYTKKYRQPAIRSLLKKH